MRREFAMPDAGEGLTEAEILTWHVAPGDTVVVNQVIVEVETAKAAVELPCPYAGVVTELLAEPGATVAVGVPIIAIETEPAEATKPTKPTTPKKGTKSAPGTVAAPNGASPAGDKPGADRGDGPAERISTLVGYGPPAHTAGRRRRKSSAPVEAHAEPSTSTPSTVPLAKPPVRKLAKDLGIDLHTVTGSGPKGVIVRDDLRPPAEPTASTAPASAGIAARREPIRGVRKAMARAMVESAFTAPHVTEFLTVDVTAMIELRDRLRASAEFAEIKLTPLAFVAKAVCLAAGRTPEINSSWDEDAGEIVYHGALHLGIAAATARGLIVPKIRDAETLSLRGLAEALTGLTEVARAGRTAPADLVGGTFTITNVGVFGVDTGTPIINPGEAAILALGAVKPAPWVVDGQLAVRTVCHLALSFDHRLVDGEQGSRFLAEVGTLLSDPGRALAY